MKLGITDLFPKLADAGQARRRIILGLSFFGLLTLACVESSLAILREQIVEADSALKLALAGPQGTVVTEPTDSTVPVVGQAVLGFVLPWILAMVAIPLEMLLESSRHVISAIASLLLQGLGMLLGMFAQLAATLGHAAPFAYDVYISIPLRIERALRGRDEDHGGRGSRKLSTAERRIRDAEAV